MTQRPLCPVCKTRPVAINYIRDGVPHHRTVCDACARKKKKIRPATPSWALAGYKKKPHCEKCGFVAKLSEQLQVFHLDGNLKNAGWANLKTICANCSLEIYKSKLPWRPSAITPDF